MSHPTSPAWTDAARAAAFDAWLAPPAVRLGLDTASLRLASADASFRRYLRIDRADGAGSLIVMDAPPDKEDCRPFVQVAALMEEAGLRVPEVLDWNGPLGFMLITDLGRRTVIEALDPGDPQAALPHYLAAVDALVAWQKASKPGVLPAYDGALLRRELALFPEWYLGRHRGVQLDAAQQQVLDTAFDAIVRENLAVPQVYVHRDFMTRNLMLPSGGDPRPGVLDFQDAVHGPITYDIASLLRDAFISWPEEFVIDVTVRYWEAARRAGLPVHEDFGAFWRAVEWMGLQRHLKVAGIFARLTLRDGKPRYLGDAPRFIHYVRATADRYRELGPFLKLIDEIEGIEAQTGWVIGR
ncbi:aminoglycoside phosphotransferase family protein [Xylophilus sp.]|uniref:aminoglycoside phosphotransferase family protein n=1 Tax=Xylophilus sp. TaxID=2653893 RepID=UPI0013BB2E20|nr:phosphotransferase [Xylophilus sp.]KAF1044085.1 MAG: N-acetylmuramate/N-acetylglucosamine kinase [Xylophilus sp.]